jgi:hypothetical protein
MPLPSPRLEYRITEGSFWGDLCQFADVDVLAVIFGELAHERQERGEAQGELDAAAGGGGRGVRAQGAGAFLEGADRLIDELARPRRQHGVPADEAQLERDQGVLGALGVGRDAAAGGALGAEFRREVLGDLIQERLEGRIAAVGELLHEHHRAGFHDAFVGDELGGVGGEHRAEDALRPERAEQLFSGHAELQRQHGAQRLGVGIERRERGDEILEALCGRLVGARRISEPRHRLRRQPASEVEGGGRGRRTDDGLA